jgi:hypothetical protein
MRTAEDFVKRFEDMTEESIRCSYQNIDTLYNELGVINELFTRLSNKRDVPNKQSRLQEYQDSIKIIYDDIRFFKECIDLDLRELKRVRTTYGSKNSFKLTQENEFSKPYEFDPITETFY